MARLMVLFRSRVVFQLCRWPHLQGGCHVVLPGYERLVREAEHSDGLRAVDADIVLRSGDRFETDRLQVLSEAIQLLMKAFDGLSPGKDAASVQAEGDPLATVLGQFSGWKGDSVIAILRSVHGGVPIVERQLLYYTGKKEAHTSLRRQRRGAVLLRWRLRLVCESYLSE
jgi:hypothetical protein